MEYAVFSTEIFAMIILSVILYGTCFESRQKSNEKSAFIKLVMGVFLTIFLDSMTYMPINWDRRYSLHYLLTMAVFTAPFFIYALFIRYIHIYISAKAEISKTLFLAGECYCCLAAVAAVYCGLKGYIFDLTDNVFSPGVYYDVYMFTYGVLLLYTMVIICVNGSKLGFHDAMAALMFAVIPAFFIFLNIAYEECSFMIPSLSVSMLVIHIMLQAEEESQLIAHDAAVTELARSDKMTGLQNRLAYTETCEKMTREDMPLGVIFCDVNGLKYANDTFGHKAGDELLCEFAEILENCFRKDDIFRISGDEFVVLLSGMPQGLFNTKAKELRRLIKKNDVPIASTGKAYGVEAEVQQLIEKAETKMYENKKAFHKKFPDYSREQE